MKKHLILMCVCAMGLSACSLDEVRQDIDALENRVAALEEWQASLNSDILALKQLVAGLEERNLITSVTPVLEQGVEVGYRITFQTGDPIVIYHGEDSSYIPLFGVAENNAGDYCWTLDGEFIKDKNGNLIPASSGIAPQVRINSDKIWEISTDGGQTWKSTGVPATGEKGDTGDALFADIDCTTDPESVTFTLADGTVLVIPRCMELGIGFADGNGIYAISPDNNVIELILTGITADNYNAIIAELKAEDGTSDIDIATKAGDEVVVTPPAFYTNGTIYSQPKVTINKTVADADYKGYLKVTVLDKEGNEASVSRVLEFYANGEEAKLVQAALNGGSYTLTQDVTLSKSLRVAYGKTLELDLGGHTLSNTSDIWDNAAGDYSLISVRGGNLVIKNGTVKAKENDAYAIDVYDGGSLIIEDGTYVGNMDCIYVELGSLQIKGGTFSIQQLSEAGKEYDYLINCKDDYYESGVSTISITGGTFVGFNPANNGAEGPGTNFVPEGYCSKISDSQDGKTIYTVTQTTETTTAEDFSAAIEAQASEIVLGADVNLQQNIQLSERQKIDLGGNTLTVNSVQAKNDNSELLISNGTVKLSGAYGNGIELVAANTTLTLDNVVLDASAISNAAITSGSNDVSEWCNNTLIIRNSTINASNNQAAGILFENAHTITLENTTVNHDYFGLTQNGVNPGSKVTLKNCNISGTYSGIYLSNHANGAKNTLVVEGGSIHSEEESAIEVKKTDIAVRDCVLSSDAATQSYSVNGSGSNGIGYGIVLAGYKVGTPYEGTTVFENLTFNLPAENAINILKYNGSEGVRVE